jgi:hypothetical protein
VLAARRGACVMGGSSGMTWYVSYIASGDMLVDRPHRATKTFENETKAREFARARAKAGDRTLIAGTINPVTPKRVIPSAAIPDWLDDESTS